MTVKEIDEAIVTRKEQIEGWTAQVADKRAGLAGLIEQKSIVRRLALRKGDKKAAEELDALRQAEQFCQDEITDLTEEIAIAEKEITALTAQRVVAAADESWASFMSEAKIAVTEAEDLELYLTSFLKLVATHGNRLSKMNLLAQAAGVTRSFDQRNLWRRFSALMYMSDPRAGWGRQSPIYHSDSYDKILRHLFDVIDAQRAPREKAANE